MKIKKHKIIYFFIIIMFALHIIKLFKGYSINEKLLLALDTLKDFSLSICIIIATIILVCWENEIKKLEPEISKLENDIKQFKLNGNLDDYNNANNDLSKKSSRLNSLKRESPAFIKLLTIIGLIVCGLQIISFLGKDLGSAFSNEKDYFNKNEIMKRDSIQKVEIEKLEKRIILLENKEIKKSPSHR